MKNRLLLYCIITYFFSFNCWAQNSSNLLNEKKIDGTANNVTINQKSEPKGMKVKYYHVEETVPIKFGGHKTVYDVSNPKLIRTYDLGPNSTRIVTPVYEKVQQKENVSQKPDEPLKIEETKLSSSEVTKKSDTIASIDIIKTYERVLGKGYESVDMLKMIANYYFFNNELSKAEKCYTKLFNKTSDLDPAYYFHYAISLKSVGQIDKSNEYFKKFYELTASENTR